MYHPTPYRWTTGRGLTHVFYNNHMPPGSGFGWSSLCDAVHLPIEGEHFELNQDASEEKITCEHCQQRIGGSSVDTDDDSMAVANGCLVRFERNEDGVIDRAEKVSQGMLHYSLAFEPETFSGNLHEESNEVCSECWETYVDHQWSQRDEGAELCIEVWGDGGRSEYFTTSAETIQDGGETVLRLQSKNDLEKDIPREQVTSITLTPTRNINY